MSKSQRQDDQRPHGRHHRRGVRHRPGSGATAFGAGARRHRRHRRKAGETEASLHGPALLRVLDVADAEAQRDFAGEVRDWAPRPIGAVFNNAGVATASSVLDAAPEDDNWLWNINFHGVVNGTRAFLPILVEQDEGAIVNTSSVFGLVGMPNRSAYCSAKFAVRGFTDSLRQELRGTGVTAINVHPGGINTNIARNARWRKDPEGRGCSHEQMAGVRRRHMTQPDKAAEIIHRGVEQGKARHPRRPRRLSFRHSRLAPTRYYDRWPTRVRPRRRVRQAPPQR
jgi:NAD(P)-dependent dehydrogenase (short-subunit alcohol dehydrogenase family)